MSILTTSGQPSDATGNSGDYAIDPIAHYIWGPKTTTWAGTASSLAGPSGPGLVYGNGAPTNAQGQIGQGYLDLSTGNFFGPKQSNGAWGNAVSKIQGAPGTSVLTGSGSPITNGVYGVSGQVYIDTVGMALYTYANGGWGSSTSMVGATGAPGPTYLTGMSAGIGTCGLLPSTTLSATPTVIPLPGTTTPASFTPLSPSALMGVYIYSGAASTVALYDTTAGSTVYSISLTAGQSLNPGYFATTAYPLQAGHTYQWQATGSATGGISVEPFYLMPANSPGLCIQVSSPAGFSTNTTFSATSQKLPYYGTTLSAGTWGHSPPRTAGIYAAQATYTPASGTAASASVTLKLYYGALTTGSGAAVGYTFAPVTATGLPQTICGPTISDATSLPTGYYFYWQATGTGTGTLMVQLLPLV